MAENSKIEWTHHTCNLWHGCTEVHAGCDNCYARVLDNRWQKGKAHWGNDSTRKIINSVWNDFIKYQRLAEESNSGEYHRVFVGSMMDIFEKPMPLVDSKGIKIEGTTADLRNRYFNEIVPATPNLMHLMLTKRPSNIPKYIPESWKENPPHNVMFGTSPVDQATADKLIPQLLQVNGKIFLSIEPMLDKIALTQWLGNRSDGMRNDVYKCPECGFVADGQFMTCYSSNESGTEYFSECQKCHAEISEEDVVSSIDWIIVGGESGQKKRPFNPDWARDIKAQCEGKVPFFMKQIDKIKPIPDDLMVRELPDFKLPETIAKIIRKPKKKPIPKEEKRYFLYDLRNKFLGEHNEKEVSDIIGLSINSINNGIRQNQTVKGLYRVYNEKQH